MEENRIMDIELTPDMFEKLDDSKKNSEKISYESKTYLADAWGSFNWIMFFGINGYLQYFNTNVISVYL